MRALTRAALLSGGFLLCACGPKSGDKAASRDLSQFECNDRMISYMVAGGFGAEEAGVTVECDNANPRLTKWRSEEGERSESVHYLTADQFDTLWKNIDASGWRHVDEDCKNPDAEDGDPAYLIEVGDHASSVTLSCEGKTLPFPYDRLVNELDLRAAGFGDQDAPVR